MHATAYSRAEHALPEGEDEMIRTSSVALPLFLLVIASCGAATEDDLQKRLVGKWHYRQEAGDVSVDGYHEYLEDGTAKISGVLVTPKGKQTFECSGTWAIKGKKLTCKVTKTTLPDLLPVGTVVSDTIVSIDEKHLKYIDDEDGKEYTETRVKGDG
jgi:hypothetical protein